MQAKIALEAAFGEGCVPAGVGLKVEIVGDRERDKHLFSPTFWFCCCRVCYSLTSRHSVIHADFSRFINSRSKKTGETIWLRARAVNTSTSHKKWYQVISDSPPAGPGKVISNPWSLCEQEFYEIPDMPQDTVRTNFWKSLRWMCGQKWPKFGWPDPTPDKNRNF